MKKEINWSVKFLGVLGAMTFLTFAIGFGCGQDFRPKGLHNIGLSIDENELNIIPGARTTSVSYSNQVLLNMVALSGVERASTAATQVWERNRAAFSEDGKANTLNAPAMGATAKLAAEICQQLNAKEESFAQGEAGRRIYTPVDFSQGPNQLDNGELTTIIRNLGRSFWSPRTPTESEIDDIIAGYRDIASTAGNDANGTEVALIGICTAMLSALDAQTN